MITVPLSFFCGCAPAIVKREFCNSRSAGRRTPRPPRMVAHGCRTTRTVLGSFATRSIQSHVDNCAHHTVSKRVDRTSNICGPCTMHARRAHALDAGQSCSAPTQPRPSTRAYAPYACACACMYVGVCDCYD